MDLSSIIGIIIGLSAIIGGQMLESGTGIQILHPTAAIIVFGGTLGATLLNYPLNTFIDAIKSLKRAFVTEHIDFETTISNIVDLTEITRREGNLTLESIVPNIENDFMRKGVQLVADSASSRVIRDILNTQINQEEEQYLLASRVFETAGGFAPTFGIVGAVLGLIQVMQHIADPTQLGQGIATAFIATLYGVGVANLILIPLGGKIRIKAREELLVKEMILEGIMSIHAGDNPAIVEEKMYSFLKSYDRPVVSDEMVENEGW